MKQIHWIKLFTFKYSINDIIDYFRANIRYKLYYSKLNWLISTHIKEQIDFRINIMMDRECYNTGSCKICGCTTTNLQMTNKSCEGDCYPFMQNIKTWRYFKKRGIITDNKYTWQNNNFIFDTDNPEMKNYIKKELKCGIE